MSKNPSTNTAVQINDYLHTLDVLQPLAWHMARGLSERIAALPSGPSEPAPQHMADLWVAVRLMAEGSDWKRDQGETLTHWAQRKLRASSEAGAERAK